MENEELKNCPCCGKLESVQWDSMTNEGPWALWCYTEDGGCGIGTNWHDTKEEAIACWNRRTLREKEQLFDWLVGKFKTSSLKMSGLHHWVFNVSQLPTATSALEAIRAAYRREHPEEKEK